MLQIKCNHFYNDLSQDVFASASRRHHGEFSTSLHEDRTKMEFDDSNSTTGFVCVRYKSLNFCEKLVFSSLS